KTVALRDSSEFRIVGTDIPRADVPAKVTGQAQFGLDVRVPGMLYAVIARCPTFGGKPARFEATAAKAVRGVKHVVEIPAVEPMNATVHVRADGAEAWVPSQGPQWAKDVIAKTADLPAEKVDVHTTLMGGGFGRRYHADFIVEAAQVSKAVGAPVQVVWTRSD